MGDEAIAWQDGSFKILNDALLCTVVIQSLLKKYWMGYFFPSLSCAWTWLSKSTASSAPAWVQPLEELAVLKPFHWKLSFYWCVLVTKSLGDKGKKCPCCVTGSTPRPSRKMALFEFRYKDMVLCCLLRCFPWLLGGFALSQRGWKPQTVCGAGWGRDAGALLGICPNWRMSSSFWSPLMKLQA